MAEEKEKKNKFQERADEQTAAAEKAYADLRELYDNPTDEQILAVMGNNLRGYQRNMGNKAGSWGSSLFGTLNKETRNALEAGYQNSLNANKKTVSQKQNEVIGTYGNGNVTRGMQAKVRSWGDKIVDTDNITPEQVRELNTIMNANGFTEFAIPTTQVTTKNDNGEDVVTNVEQNISLSDLLNSMSPEEIDALDDLGFIDDDLNYLRPHNETFEEKLARKERERERIELAAQQQALERQRTRAGLADLVAGFGDMAKAAGGAMVTPRDYQAVYNSLTAQQQKNYDNYLLRMQAAKEDEKKKQALLEERKYQAQQLKNKQQFQRDLADLEFERKKELIGLEQDWKSDESEKTRKHEQEVLDKKIEAEQEQLIAKLGAEATKEINKGRKIYIGTTAYPANEDLFYKLYAYFNSHKNYIDKDNVEARLNFDPLSKEQFASEGNKTAVYISVQKALEDFDRFPDSMKNEIKAAINGVDISNDTTVHQQAQTTVSGLGRFGQ